MSLYQNPIGEIREIDAELYAAWVAAGNGKAQHWQQYTPPTEVPAVPVVPAEVSNQQLRLALIDAGIMPSAILAQLQSMPAGADRERALAAWEYANTFRREHPLVSALALQLGLSSDAVDALFIAAEKLG